MLIGRDWKFTGTMGKKKLIEIFVELHYIWFGRPNDDTIALIFSHTRELDCQYPRFTKELGRKH
jgi:hypothetical protein